MTDTPTAASFRRFEQAFADAKQQKIAKQKSEALQARHDQVSKMINTELTDLAWDDLIQHAQTAAARGGKEFLLLRFPSDLCTDGSRAINNQPNLTWPATLQGIAADIFARWETHLRSQGFIISAQVLDFPNGKPGDVGLFLRWDTET